MSEKQARAGSHEDDSHTREWAATVSDEEINTLALKAKNGSKYQALIEGRWKEAGYRSEREATAALILILGFYVGRDRQRIERLMRQTKLKCEMWDKAGPGGRTHITTRIETILLKKDGGFYRPKAECDRPRQLSLRRPKC